MDPTEAYKYDNTFRQIVDIMRQELQVYRITPAELRQAVILAATMHEAENIRPIMFFTPYGAGEKTLLTYAETLYPSMFGGAESGRIQTSKPNFTEQDKPSDLDLMLKYNCICGYEGTNKHSQTCKDYNWNVTHPVLLTTPKPYPADKGTGFNPHVFSIICSNCRICCHCGLSDVYVKHEYKNFNNSVCKKS